MRSASVIRAWLLPCPSKLLQKQRLLSQGAPFQKDHLTTNMVFSEFTKKSLMLTQTRKSAPTLAPTRKPTLQQAQLLVQLCVK